MAKPVKQYFQLESRLFYSEGRIVRLINSQGSEISKFELQFIPQGVLKNNENLVFKSMETRRCQEFKPDTSESRIIDILPHSFISSNLLLGTNENGLCLFDAESERYLWSLDERFMILSYSEQFILGKVTKFNTVIVALIEMRTGEKLWEIDLKSQIEVDKGVTIRQTGSVKLDQEECSFYLSEGLIVSVNIKKGKISRYTDLRATESFPSTNIYLFLDNDKIYNITESGILQFINESTNQEIIDLKISDYGLNILVLRNLIVSDKKIILGAQQNKKGDAENYVQNSSLIFLDIDTMQIGKVMHLNQTIKKVFYLDDIIWCVDLNDEMVKLEEIEED